MASSILTQSFPGAPGGMNVALPQQELDDTEARYIEDGLVDYPGLVRRRGPVDAVANIAQPSRPGTGLAMTLDPKGQDRYVALTGDGSNGYFSVWAADLQSITDLAWPHPLPTDPVSGIATAYRIVDAHAALTGGAMVGVSSAYDANSPNQGLAFWKGGTKANYTTGTLSVARGSAAVTGSGTSWLSTVTPGMFLFANTDDPYTQTLIGTVLQVNTDTSLTLQQISPYAATAKAYTLQSIRGIAPRVSIGRITVDTTSKVVNGGNTKFRTQGLVSGSWDIYRANDLIWVGTVDGAVAMTDTSLTLKANAAISMADDSYIAIRADSDYSISTTGNVNKPGFLTAAYAERQWYANNGAQFDKTIRVWFSEPSDPESLDMSEDGNWIPVSSTGSVQEPVRALAPAYNALLVVKENETFAIYGTNPDTFAVRKIADDGTLGGMSVQPYGGGAIWAGREGIHFYDGIQVTNLIELKLGDVWKNSIHSFNPDRYRMYSAVIRNHYILWVERLDPTIAIVKGNTSSTPTSWVVAVNMVTNAVTMLTNVHMRGSIILPASTGREVWFLVNGRKSGDVSDKAYVIDAAKMFDAEGLDVVIPNTGTVGPDFFFESKKFDAGSATQLKRFKHLIQHYLVQGGDLKIDTVLGLNNVGKTLTTVFPQSVYTWDTLRASISTWDALKAQFATWSAVIQGVFVPKRARFLKKSQHMSFRIYQSNANISRLRLGPFEIGFKLMRPGRV